jgi:hypothetical protein
MTDPNATERDERNLLPLCLGALLIIVLLMFVVVGALTGGWPTESS